jgi:hypothetical protein
MSVLGPISRPAAPESERYPREQALHGKRFRDAAKMGARRALLGHHWPRRSAPLNVRNFRRAISRDDSLSPDRAAISAGKGLHAPGPWRRAIVHGTAFPMGAGSGLGLGHSVRGPWKRSLRRQPPSGARSGLRRCGAMFPQRRGLKRNVVPLSSARSVVSGKTTSCAYSCCTVFKLFE